MELKGEHFCYLSCTVVQEGRTQMQYFSNQKVYSKKAQKPEPKVRQSRISKILKLWLTKTRLWIRNKQDYGTVADKTVRQREVRILQRLWLNLETKCCGEVIGDDVQLWNGKQVTWVNLTWQGKKHDLKPENITRKHYKWPENKNTKTETVTPFMTGYVGYP